MSEANWKESFEGDVDRLMQNEMLTTEFRKKRLTAYIIRTVLTIVIYFIFWDYEWVRWTLLVTVPLNLFSLVMIFAGPAVLRRKAEGIKKSVQGIEEKADTP